MVDVVIVTEKGCLKIDPQVEYSAMGVEENDILKKAFTLQNINCEIVAWDDTSFDWTTTKVALIRTTWNYFHLIPEFKMWVKNTSKKCKLINGEDLILWNMNKNYLFDLQAKGIRIPETHILDANEAFEPEHWIEKLGTKGFVVKPTISGGSKDTYFLKAPFNQVEIKAIKQDIKRQDTMIQAFVQSIIEKGEISMIFIGGVFVHAMLKTPKKNDFRVQPYHGGTHKSYDPDLQEIAFGKSVLKACQEIRVSPVYARIDFCYSNTDELLLMELEVIEPQLWLTESSLAVSSLIASVKSSIA